MDNSRIVSYCYLATLNNQNTDLFNSVYIPLCNRALSSYANDEKTGGRALDIKEEILRLYCLNIPVVTVKQMLRGIERHMTNKEKSLTGFKTFQSGDTFQFARNSFLSSEEDFKQEERDVNKLQAKFQNYLRALGLDPSVYAPIFNYIDKNRIGLSILFGQNAETHNNHEERFVYHAQFLQEISKSDNYLFGIARKMYLGSIIAAYIESSVPPDQKLKTSVTYYIDTQVILNALDLRSEEHTNETRELLDLIRKTNGKLKVLDITLAELSKVLDDTIQNISNQILPGAIPNDSIEHACSRKGLTKTDLQNLQSSLVPTLIKELGVQIEKVPESIILKSSKTVDYEELKLKWQKPFAALHDVQAYLFIRMKRHNSFVRSFQQAMYWFVTANCGLVKFNRAKIPNNSIPEVIATDNLTSVLWLSFPKLLSDDIANIGLSQLITQAIVSTRPPTSLLCELEKNIKKYTNLSEEEYSLLMLNLAKDSTDKLANLNEAASDDEAFNTLIVARIEEEKSIRAKAHEELLEAKVQIAYAESDVNQLQQEKTILSLNTELSAQAVKDLTRKLQEQNEELVQQRMINESLSKKHAKMTHYLKLGAILAITLFFGSVLWFYKGQFKTIIQFIAAGGGIWSFGSFAINAYKLKK